MLCNPLLTPLPHLQEAQRHLQCAFEMLPSSSGLSGEPLVLLAELLALGVFLQPGRLPGSFLCRQPVDPRMCLPPYCAADATASLAGEPSTGTLAAPESPAAAAESFETAPTVAAWGQPAVAAAWGQPAAAPAWGQPSEAEAPLEVEAAGDLPASLSSSLTEPVKPQLAPAGPETTLAQAATDGGAAAEEGGAAEAAWPEAAPVQPANEGAEAATDAAEGDAVEDPGSLSDSLVLHGSVNHTLLMPGKVAGWRWPRCNL